MMTFLISFVAFLVSVSILVAFHEWGHFWVARRLGIKVLRFSIGFGKSLWRFHDRKGTEYVIAALPFGGYVKLLDERESPITPALKPYVFNRKPLWARAAVVLGGPLFNFIFAILAYWCVYLIGTEGGIPLVGEIKPLSIAEESGIHTGDEIVAVDHVKTETWSQVMKQLLERLGDKDPLYMTLKGKDGAYTEVTLPLVHWKVGGSRPDLLAGLGITPYRPPVLPVIEQVMHGEPAEKAGLLAGDQIVAINQQPISLWKEVTSIVEKSTGQPLTIVVERGKAQKTLTLVPRGREAANAQMAGFAGVMVKIPPLPKSLVRQEQLGPVAALKASLIKTKKDILITFKMIWKMVRGEIGLYTLSGPVTIAQGAGVSAMGGIAYFLSFLALISVSLGVLNLLPIPILDGGHLLYLAIEGIMRKPVSERVQLYGVRMGMLLLIFLMGVAFYNDFLRLL